MRKRKAPDSRTKSMFVPSRWYMSKAVRNIQAIPLEVKQINASMMFNTNTLRIGQTVTIQTTRWL